MLLRYSASVDTMGNREHDSHEHDCDGKNRQEDLNRIDICSGFFIIAKEIYHNYDNNQHDCHLRQHNDGQSPQCTPPAVAEELAVGNIHINEPKHEFDSSAPVAKETQEESLDAQEYLQEETLRQHMSGVVRGKAEHQPCRQDIKRLEEQRCPTFLGIDPSDDIVNLLNVELNLQDIILQMEHRLENNNEKTDNDQHLDRRERYLTMATDVVAYQIAWTPQQLDERISERAGVQSPQNSYVILDGVPPHTSHLGTLTAARTEIVGKPGAAVMAALDGVLMTIDIMRYGLLPAAEAVVIL